MQLAGRTAIVTGAAQGIGAAVARAFADSGARVCVVDLDLERADALAETLRAGGAEAIGIGCDVSRRDQVDAMVAATHQHFGRVDILINNAGITRPAMLHKMTEAMGRGHGGAPYGELQLFAGGRARNDGTALWTHR